MNTIIAQKDLISITDGQPTTTSIALADGTNTQHKNVMELIRKYADDLQVFGRVAFQTLPFETAGGSADKHKPANFLRLEATKGLIVEIEEENSYCSDLSNKKIAFKSMTGRFGGSYGCKELIYSYAMWINANFNFAFFSLSVEKLLRLEGLDCQFLERENVYQHKG